MQTIPYVECDREGYNNKREMCKEKELPGYPTWEIGGELFPGEKSLDELREIVDDINCHEPEAITAAPHINTTQLRHKMETHISSTL